MRVMVIVKATKTSETGAIPTEQEFLEMGRYNEQLVQAGIMQMADGLKPTSAGYRVKFSGADRTVVQGPFGAPNDQIAGFWLWNVESVDEAIEWVKKCPNPMREDSEIEIRPFYELSDFAESNSPELQELGSRIRTELEKQTK